MSEQEIPTFRQGSCHDELVPITLVNRSQQQTIYVSRETLLQLGADRPIELQGLPEGIGDRRLPHRIDQYLRFVFRNASSAMRQRLATTRGLVVANINDCIVVDAAESDALYAAALSRLDPAKWAKPKPMAVPSRSSRYRDTRLHRSAV